MTSITAEIAATAITITAAVRASHCNIRGLLEWLRKPAAALKMKRAGPRRGKKSTGKDLSQIAKTQLPDEFNNLI
jgi:hypothetical protein